MKTRGAGKRAFFREDLVARLKDPKFRKAFEEADAEVRLAVMVAQAREKAGVTQAGLAKMIHTKQSNISRLERGAQNVTVGTLEKIARVLHLKLEIQLRPA